MHLSNNTLLHNGKYKIVRFISSGGFGCTYEGVHCDMNSRVAIKEFFVSDFCDRDPDGTVSIVTTGKRELAEKLRNSFTQEARSVFAMRHPGIVRVMDIFEDHNTAYYVMDYIDGKSLNDIVKERGTLSEGEVLRYIRQVADALEYVHDRNRLHLDIKPANIMVDRAGNAILIDFGASKHYDSETHEQTSTMMGMNTPGYAPPEQMSSTFTNFNPATDIYALGATMYKLLTGVTPHDSISLMSQEITLKPLPPYVSQATRNAIECAMNPLRAKRPQSIREFLQILDGYQQPLAAGGGGGAGNNSDATQISTPDAPVSQPTAHYSPEYHQKDNRRVVDVKWIIIAVLGTIVVGLLIWLLASRSGDSPVEEPVDTTEQETAEAEPEQPEEPEPPVVESLGPKKFGSDAAFKQFAREYNMTIRNGSGNIYNNDGTPGPYNIEIAIYGDRVYGRFHNPYAKVNLDVNGTRQNGVLTLQLGHGSQQSSCRLVHQSGDRYWGDWYGRSSTKDMDLNLY